MQSPVHLLPVYCWTCLYSWITA